MALTPLDEVHALQIQAGILGRKAGHTFEDRIAQEINFIRSKREAIKTLQVLNTTLRALELFKCSAADRLNIRHSFNSIWKPGIFTRFSRACL
jgi:hypothetical protein